MGEKPSGKSAYLLYGRSMVWVISWAVAECSLTAHPPVNMNLVAAYKKHRQVGNGSKKDWTPHLMKPITYDAFPL